MRKNRMNEIVEAAHKLFCEKGYEATSISDLCEATNLTNAGIYHYIKSKEDLLNKVDERYYQRIKAALTKQRTGRDAEEDFREFIGSLVKEIFAEEDTAHLLLTKALDRGEMSEQAKERRRDVTEIVRQRLREIAPKNGSIDINSAAFVLIGIVTWSSFWFKPGGKMSVDDLIDQLSELFLKGFLGSRKRTARS
jgi:AcrR family transcriptional regulator